MADYPHNDLGGKTLLEAAKTPNMDYISKNGTTGLVSTVPPGFSPGSDIANMGLLGYEPSKYYTGRGPIEATSLGIDIPKDKIVFRCNFVFIKDSTMQSFNADHITTKESDQIIKELNNYFDSSEAMFYTGVSYRHILLLDQKFLNLTCSPPHDITDKNIKDFLPQGQNAQALMAFMQKCQSILDNSNINKKRIQNNLAPANSIWPWGQGREMKLPSFYDKFGLEGGVVTAVDLLKGLGQLAGLETPDIPGATGYLDTNYQEKVKKALEILKRKDFVYLHIEAPDEAGHLGDINLKIKAIEDFDKNVVGPILDYQRKNNNIHVMVLPDHPTPCSLKTHTCDPVPFAIYYANIGKGSNLEYSEKEAAKSDLSFKFSWDLLKYFLQK
jgi:2,3-bisphosphoglycerate-independent phosphoglycerate mutase